MAAAVADDLDLPVGRAGLLSTADGDQYLASVEFDGAKGSFSISLVGPDMAAFSGVFTDEQIGRIFKSLPVPAGRSSWLEEAALALIAMMSGSSSKGAGSLSTPGSKYTLRVVAEGDALVLQLLTTKGTNMLTSAARLCRATASRGAGASTAAAGRGPWEIVSGLVAQEERARVALAASQAKLHDSQALCRTLQSQVTELLLEIERQEAVMLARAHAVILRKKQAMRALYRQLETKAQEVAIAHDETALAKLETGRVVVASLKREAGMDAADGRPAKPGAKPGAKPAAKTSALKSASKRGGKAAGKGRASHLMAEDDEDDDDDYNDDDGDGRESSGPESDFEASEEDVDDDDDDDGGLGRRPHAGAAARHAAFDDDDGGRGAAEDADVLWGASGDALPGSGSSSGNTKRSGVGRAGGSASSSSTVARPHTSVGGVSKVAAATAALGGAGAGSSSRAASGPLASSRASAPAHAPQPALPAASAPSGAAQAARQAASRPRKAFDDSDDDEAVHDDL